MDGTVDQVLPVSTGAVSEHTKRSQFKASQHESEAAPPPDQSWQSSHIFACTVGRVGL